MNDPLDSIRDKQWVIQMTHAAYLDQLVGHSASQPMVGQPVVSPPVTAPPVVSQPGCPIPPLLSLCPQPNLNVLARILSPQALRYIHFGIQIGRNLLN